MILNLVFSSAKKLENESSLARSMEMESQFENSFLRLAYSQNSNLVVRVGTFIKDSRQQEQCPQF